MSAELEQQMVKLVEEVKRLREMVETPLPAMLSLPAAALQLSVDVRTLHRMIARGELATHRYEVGGHQYIPSSEVRRIQGLAKPAVTPRRTTARKPASTRYDAEAELEKLRIHRQKRRR